MKNTEKKQFDFVNISYLISLTNLFLLFYVNIPLFFKIDQKHYKKKNPL